MTGDVQVEIFTDGACRGNPGPGGWGALLRAGPHERELWGGEDNTTNNRMEMTAIRSQGHHRVDQWLEAARLENRKQGTGQKR